MTEYKITIHDTSKPNSERRGVRFRSNKNLDEVSVFAMTALRKMLEEMKDD